MCKSFCLAAVVLAAMLLVASSPSNAFAKVKESDRQLVVRVADRIIAVAEPVEGWQWPPKVFIKDDEVVNAYAMLLPVSDPENPGELPLPAIQMNQGYLDKVVQGKEDRLAAVMGHELAHILLRHVENALPGSPLVANAITRQQEEEADILGTKLAVKAGFNHRGIVEDYEILRTQNEYTSFEGLSSTHPGPTDRLASIDEQQAEFWHATSAFENGVFFLISEQYPLAERCFNQVTKEFPTCYEAWGNLGYARLMMYCDALAAEDLRQFDLGHLVVGGFYRRPTSLVSTRGVDEEMWFDAVEAIREALRLKPDLVLPKANLAVAYLLRPVGKDVGRAAELFDEVLIALGRDNEAEEIDAPLRAALLVNAGVAELANSDVKSAERLFSRAQALIAPKPQDPLPSGTVAGAIQYNRARLLAASPDQQTRRSAIAEFEAYLAAGSSFATWWSLAYEQYEKLCAVEGTKPKSREDLVNPSRTRVRLVTSVTLATGEQIVLDDPLQELVSRIGEGVRLDVVRRSNVHRRKYSDLGLELLCTDRILAIRLRDAKAPPVTLRVAGLGGESRQLRVGMPLRLLEETLGASAETWETRAGTSEAVLYRFFPAVGVGARINDRNDVTELIVAQLPRETREG